MNTAIIVNPIAGAGMGGGRVESIGRTLERVLADEHVEASVQFTKRAGHAFELAVEALESGATLVVAWGGDGTVNEVASALVLSSATLGIVPAGSGNGLARELSIPRSPALALRTVFHGSDRILDVGMLGDRLFANVAGIGLDAWVAQHVNRPGRRLRGLLPYMLWTATGLFVYEPAHYVIRLDNETIEQDALAVVVANSCQYGNGARVAPSAQVDDGHLDLVLIPPRPPLSAIWQARRLFDGRFLELPGVVHRSVDHIRVTSNKAIVFHLDGEVVVATTELTARVRPGALRVRVPEANTGPRKP